MDNGNASSGSNDQGISRTIAASVLLGGCVDLHDLILKEISLVRGLSDVLADGFHQNVSGEFDTGSVGDSFQLISEKMEFLHALVLHQVRNGDFHNEANEGSAR